MGLIQTQLILLHGVLAPSEYSSEHSKIMQKLCIGDYDNYDQYKYDCSLNNIRCYDETLWNDHKNNIPGKSPVISWKDIKHQYT